jgi:predicted transcriptional regulator of viral defense system
MLVDPKLDGGIRSVKDILEKLLKKDAQSLEQLIDYADQLGNGSVFKRLGFLLEIVATEETNALDACRKKMTTGNARLDPSLDNDRLITRWRLFVPENSRSASSTWWCRPGAGCFRPEHGPVYRLRGLPRAGWSILFGA